MRFSNHADECDVSLLQVVTETVTEGPSEDLSKLTVSLLKDRLMSLGLPHSGRKAALILRLHTRGPKPAAQPNTADEGQAGGQDVEWEDVGTALETHLPAAAGAGSAAHVAPQQPAGAVPPSVAQQSGSVLPEEPAALSGLQPEAVGTAREPAAPSGLQPDAVPDAGEPASADGAPTRRRARSKKKPSPAATAGQGAEAVGAAEEPGGADGPSPAGRGSRSKKGSSQAAASESARPTKPRRKARKAAASADAMDIDVDAGTAAELASEGFAVEQAAPPAGHAPAMPPDVQPGTAALDDVMSAEVRAYTWLLPPEFACDVLVCFVKARKPFCRRISCVTGLF